MAPKVGTLIDSLTTKVLTLEEKLREAVDAFHALLTLHGEAITKFDNRIQVLESANTNATEIAALKEDLTSQGTNIFNLKSSMLQLDSTIEGLRDTVKGSFESLYDKIILQQPKQVVKAVTTEANTNIENPPNSPPNLNQYTQSISKKPEVPESSSKHPKDLPSLSQLPASSTQIPYMIPQRKYTSKHGGTNPPSNIDSYRLHPRHPKQLPCLLTMDPQRIFSSKPGSCPRPHSYPYGLSPPHPTPNYPFPNFYTDPVKNSNPCSNGRTQKLLSNRSAFQYNLPPTLPMSIHSKLKYIYIFET